jgi:LysM repeat protein
MFDRDSTPSVIAAYRKRQQRAERLLMLFWIVVMLVVVGAGYLVYRLLSPKDNTPQQALVTSQTPAPSQAAVQEIPTTAAPQMAVSDTPAWTDTPSGPTSTPTEAVTIYTVQSGDTMSSIATQFGVSLFDLQRLNPAVTPEFLNLGDKISVPIPQGEAPTATPGVAGEGTTLEYTVVSGDTLASIAERFGTTIIDIVRENNQDSADQIQVGQTLKIRASATPVPAAQTEPPGTPPVDSPTPAP